VLAGDPRRLHPVAGFGQAAGVLERLLWRRSRAAGALYACILVAGPMLVTAAFERRLCGRRRAAFEVLVLWVALGGRSLGRVATELARALDRGDLEAARAIVPSLVGRDPWALDADELARAGVESVAENTTDAVVAPLFWFSIAGAPAAVGYRAANTLDAIVGHRSDRYERFGWASARLDDAATWPAARVATALTALLASVIEGSAAEAWRAARVDGPAHPSPNAGRIEAAFAGALGVRLGGINRYDCLVEERPLLGGDRTPTTSDLRRAVRLSRSVGVAAAVLASLR
jgi:adenosylcobinamide-phosphate synthase